MMQETSAGWRSSYLDRNRSVVGSHAQRMERMLGKPLLDPGRAVQP
jgi:hypothetical protein